MVWQPEIEELKRRRAFSLEMGGEAGIAEQRRRGKLTVRERIDLLSDAGSFREIGQLTGAATYTRTPAPIHSDPTQRPRSAHPAKNSDADACAAAHGP